MVYTYAEASDLKSKFSFENRVIVIETAYQII